MVLAGCDFFSDSDTEEFPAGVQFREEGADDGYWNSLEIDLDGLESDDSEVATGTRTQPVIAALDLKVDDENPWSFTEVTVGNIKPGDSGVIIMEMENDGSIGGTIIIDIMNISDGAGLTPEPEPTPDNGELSANMDIVFWVDIDHDGVKDAGETELYGGKLNAEVGPHSLGSLTAGETTYVGMSYSIDIGVENVIQGDSCTFTIMYHLNQF